MIMILVFGFWINTQQVTHLSTDFTRIMARTEATGCIVHTTGVASPIVKGKTCDEVAAEIRKQLSAQGK